ncbi:Protein of unknown function [Lactobacillus helveticus CIRM-BIA 101]|uniref:Uncharacterized protein n=2 Tax=Lactobacillus helveticus TaxID=1587 RepID=U6F831_LACHE|nr:Protein of unknown function [Lactobacillus helveticus CIRM-BIA 951]CDI59459.1 Protein of unknown function [Lactobacillus helveticus CIRM-BIA 104]CDI65284.1 Protein of unknown function [Lactobacillus helveticus CIRM-BIA 101]
MHAQQDDNLQMRGGSA